MTVLFAIWIVVWSLVTLVTTIWRVYSERRLYDALRRMQEKRR